METLIQIGIQQNLIKGNGVSNMKKIFKVYKKLTFLQGAACAVSLTSIVGIAATVTGLNTFTPGSTISSSQMNTNFNILKTAIESGSSQMYVGTYNAGLAVDPPGSTTGEYYIITTAGTINAVSYAVGDWIIFNGMSWEKITPTSAISSVFGRTGAVVATSGDYNLNMLGDVDATIAPTMGQVLQYNVGTNKWAPGTIPPPTETDPTVQMFAKTSLPSCAAGEVLNSNGMFFNCVTDNNGTFSGLANRAVTTNGMGALTESATTSAELGHLSGVTSPIQTQINGKQMELGFIPINKFGDTLSTGIFELNGTAVLRTLNPITATDVVNKQYVDSFGQWVKSGPNAYYPTGNIGIGTSTPTQKLHVVGNSQFDGNMGVAQGSSSTPSFSSFNSPSTGLFFPATNTIGFSVSGMEKLRIDPSGKIGIGTTSPAYELQVNGQISGSLAFLISSDLRYKKEINKISNPLERLLAISGVSYKFKTDEFPDSKFSHRRELGVIAQTVEKVFPEAVSKDNNGFRSVAYTMLISPIIEAIREVNFKTKRLEDENKMLKSYLCERDPAAPFCE